MVLNAVNSGWFLQFGLISSKQDTREEQWAMLVFFMGWFCNSLGF